MPNEITLKHGGTIPDTTKLLSYQMGYCDANDYVYIRNGKDEVFPVNKVVKTAASEEEEADEKYPLSEVAARQYVSQAIETLKEYIDGDTFFQFFIDKVYPVGSIYISTNSRNPGQYLGGMWDSYGEGRTLIGVDTNSDDLNTGGLTGGEKETTLITENLPSHSHTTTIAASGEHTHSFRMGRSDGTEDDVYGVAPDHNGSRGLKIFKPYTYHTNANQRTGSHSHTATVSSVGEGQSFSNMPPYITCYIWKRVS